MKKRLLLLFLSIFICVAISSSQPILKSEPEDNNVDFYIITVDGKELEQIKAIEKYDWNLFKDVQELNLEDGRHKIEIRVGNENEESEEARFFILVDTFEGYKRYEIQPDPENNDPVYLSKFNDNLIAEVSKEDTKINKQKNNSGCFISTLFK